MLKLTYYELKKLFSSVLWKTLLALLILANFFICYSQTKTNNKYIPGEKSVDTVYEIYLEDPEYFYDEYRRVEEVYVLSLPYEPENMYTNGETSDYSLFMAVDKYITADKNYHDKLDEITARSQMIMNTIQANYTKYDLYNYRYQYKVIELYGRLNEEVKIDSRFVRGWRDLFRYDSEVMFSFLVITVSGVIIALGDRKNGFCTIAFSCKKGRKHMAAAKFSALMAVCFFTVIIFMLSSLAAVYFVCSLTDPTVAVQVIDELVLVHFNTGILGFIFILFVFRFLVSAVFAALVLSVSTLSKRMWAGFFVGGGLIVTNYLLSNTEAAVYGQWKYLNLWSVYDATHTLSRYRTLNFFGYVIDLLAVFAVLAFAITLICFVIHIANFSLGANMIKTSIMTDGLEKIKKALSNIDIKGKKRLYQTSLVSYELYKNKWIFAILIIIIIFKTADSADFYSPYNTAYERSYKKYIDVVGGEYTPEKKELLQSEYQRCTKIVGSYDQMYQNYLSDKITKGEFEDFMQEYMTAQSDRGVLSELLAQSIYLEQFYERGIKASYIYETAYNVYTNVDIDWFLIAFIALIGCYAYSMEYGSTSSRGSALTLIQSTPRGRTKLYIRKLYIVLISAAAVYILFFAVDIYFYSLSYDMPPLGTLLVSMKNYSNAACDITIGGYLVVTAIADFIGVMLICLVCFFMSHFLRDSLFVFSAASALFVIPYIAYRAGVEFCAYICPVRVSDFDAVFELSINMDPGGRYGWIIVIYGAVFALAVVLGTLSFSKNKRGGRI